jgi:hypothetical protein
MNQTRSPLIGSALLLVLALGLLLGFGTARVLSPRGGGRSLNTAIILRQVQGLSQLVTVKYVLEKVVVLEDIKLYGESRVLLLAHGIVKAGVDLDQLKPGDLTVRGREVIINLPRATITDVYLDESQTQVLEHSTGLFRRYDKELEQNARREALDTIRRAARYSGIVDEANGRAKEQLRGFFQQLGFDTVVIK